MPGRVPALARRRRGRARSSSRSKKRTRPRSTRSSGASTACVLTGGPDVDPARYGAEPHPRSQPPQVVRDERELALLAAAERCGPAGARRLPGDAAAQRRPRRHARPAPARRRRPRGAQPDARRLLPPPRPDRAGAATSHKALGWDGARRADPPSPGASTASADGSVGGRLGRGRHDRGRSRTRPGRSSSGVQWHPEADDDQAVFASLVEAASQVLAARDGAGCVPVP